MGSASSAPFARSRNTLYGSGMCTRHRSSKRAIAGGSAGGPSLGNGSGGRWSVESTTTHERGTASMSDCLVQISGHKLHGAAVLVMVPGELASRPGLTGDPSGPVRPSEIALQIPGETLDPHFLDCIRTEVGMTVVGEADAVR